MCESGKLSEDRTKELPGAALDCPSLTTSICGYSSEFGWLNCSLLLDYSDGCSVCFIRRLGFPSEWKEKLIGGGSATPLCTCTGQGRRRSGGRMSRCVGWLSRPHPGVRGIAESMPLMSPLISVTTGRMFDIPGSNQRWLPRRRPPHCPRFLLERGLFGNVQKLTYTSQLTNGAASKFGTIPNSSVRYRLRDCKLGWMAIT